jgi:septum formation protein
VSARQPKAVISLLYPGARPLVLASRSPRREEILRRLDVPLVVRPTDVDEEVDPELPPREQAMRTAARKAAAAVRPGVPELVLGADTIVVLGKQVLGKPADPAAARAMLADLMGRTHRVTTGLALIDTRTGAHCLSWEDTDVTMRKATAAEIAAYVATGEPLDKAGGYGIQGRGAVFVERIAGCYYNVVGLPVVRLLSMLADIRGRAAGAGSARDRRARSTSPSPRDERTLR